jgi:hypothetical protein
MTPGTKTYSRRPLIMAETAKEEGTIRTPPFRVQYPAFFKPKMYRNDQGEEDPKFECTALFPDEGMSKTDLKKLAALKKLVGDVGKAANGGTLPKKFKDPFKDGNLEDWPGFAGNSYIRMSSRYQPDIIDLHDNKVGPGDVKAGDWMIAIVKPYPYDFKGKGVSFGMRNLLLVRVDEPFPVGSTASDDFDDLIEEPKDDAFEGEKGEGLL